MFTSEARAPALGKGARDAEGFEQMRSNVSDAIRNFYFTFILIRSVQTKLHGLDHIVTILSSFLLESNT